MAIQSDQKIAIVGAGVSGLAAAVRLAQSAPRTGARRLTIFEARREAGGRTRSYLDPVTGDTLDNGQHLMMGCYRATLEYLRMIGSEHLLLRVPLSICFHEGRSSSLSGPRKWRAGEAVLRIPPKSKPPQNLLSAIRSSLLLTTREKVAAAWLGLAIAAARNKKSKDQTCAELFQTFRQPTGTIQKLWAPIVLATINAPIEEASALLFANVIREAFLSKAGSSDLLIPEAGLSEVLVDPALRLLERSKVPVRLSEPVRAIEVSEKQFSVATDGGEEIFDAVIYSAPFPDVLPAEVRSSLPHVEHSPIVNAYFWLDRTVLDDPIHGFLGSTLQWAFPKRSRYSAQVLALTVSAANELASHTNEGIRHILWTELCAALPEAREARLLHHQIIREKRATPVFTPHLQDRRPKTSTEIPGLLLAGDIVQNGLPATIEGAIRNGFAAAESLLL